MKNLLLILVTFSLVACSSSSKEATNAEVKEPENYTEIPAGYPASDWQWGFDQTTPTNRRVKTSYERGTTATTLIDFYFTNFYNIK